METTGGGFKSVSVFICYTCFAPWQARMTFSGERISSGTAFNPLYSSSKTWLKLSNNAAITQQRLGKMNAGNPVDDVPLETLSPHLEFPTPPSFSPKPIHEGKSASSPILGASGTYTRNLAISNVSRRLSVSGDEETSLAKLLWPLKVSSNQIENKHNPIITELIINIVEGL